MVHKRVGKKKGGKLGGQITKSRSRKRLMNTKVISAMRK